MDVVAHRVDFDEGRVVVFEHANNVGMELVALVVPDEGAAVLLC